MLFPPQGLVAAALQPYALLSLLLTPSVTANSQTINAAPTASTITAANTKSFTGTIGQIALPAITPAANGAGITLTGFNFTQGAISNVADSEAITVKQITITGAAGAALETGVYTWSAIEITIPNQAANGANNQATGIKITGGALAGGASAYQRGVDITMAAATDAAIRVAKGKIVSVVGDPLEFGTSDDDWAFELTSVTDTAVAVPHLTPLKSGFRLNFDLFPKGSPADVAGQGTVLIDMVSTDWLADKTNWESLRLAKYAAGQSLIGSQANGSGTVRPLWMQPFGGNLGIGIAYTTAPKQLVHVYGGASGQATAYTTAYLTIESDTFAHLGLLSPATGNGGIIVGSTVSNQRGYILYDHNTDAWWIATAGAPTATQRLIYSAGAFAFQENTTISRASVAGVAATMLFNIPVGAGGAANNVLQWSFQLDSVTEAGLLGETDGTGSYTQGKTIWKVPYRDSGANVAAPTAPTTAATWLGGVRVEAGDDTNRIYFYANEAWHYINQTAGFEIPAHETVCPHCGKDMGIGDDVIGMVDRRIGDGALHGVWRHARCKRR